MKIWFVEDTDVERPHHAYGRTKHAAQAFMSGNYGYDYYDGSRFSDCLADGNAKPAVRLDLPRPVVETLLKTCWI